MFRLLATLVIALATPGCFVFEELDKGAAIMDAHSPKELDDGNSKPKAKRVEVRYPDPTANPYLTFASMLMAGLDGIENKIDPGEPLDKNIYALPAEEAKGIPVMPASLEEALDELHADH